MASNVLKLRRPDESAQPLQLVETVSIRNKADVLDAALVLDRVARDRGMRIMVWHDISSQEPMVDAEGQDINTNVFGCDTQEEVLRNDYEKALCSQVIRACRVESEPFWVNRHGFQSRWQNPFLDKIELKDFEKRCLVKAAIVVPLHLPFGQIAAAVFVSLDESKEDLAEEFTQFGKLFSELSRQFLAGYVRTMRSNPYLPTENVLSDRQIECLRWAAFGKTDDEIAMILGCSHAGVRYHIQKAAQKLDSTNRVQATFRAGQLGYLGSLN